MAQFVFEFILVGLVGGLLGIFYRNCLKVEDMISLVVCNTQEMGKEIRDVL